MSKKYKIGQVLYIISNKAKMVLPVQVQEINQKTTIEGEETIYLVQDPENRGPIDLEEVEGEIFVNPNDAGKYLKDNANKSIDMMIKNASNIAIEAFGTSGANDIFSNKSKKNKTNKKQNDNSEPVPKKIEGELDTEILDKSGKTIVQKAKVRSISLPDGQSVRFN